MPIDREDFINCIANEITRGGLSLFLGAGVSLPIGIPSWKGLLTPLAKRLHLNIEQQYDYYALAQYYANMYGKPELKKHIGNMLFSFNTDNQALDRLLKMDPQTIWTTNFDTSIEQSLKKRLVRYQVVSNDKGLANVSPLDTVIIYKLNGDCNDLDNIVITTEDWEAYAETHPTMITFLKKELVSNTFLFYGYSFHDNLVKTVLSSIKRFVGESCNTHYSIRQSNGDKDFEYQIYDLERRYHVKTLLVHSFDEVPNIFDEIVKRVRRNNIFVSGRMGDIKPEIESEACDFCGKLSVDLLKEGYNLCTGMGRKIGYFIAGPAIQYLLSTGFRQIDQRISVRPFDDTMSTEKRSQYREKLIDDNSIVIFIYGHSNCNGRSGGMWEEYQIAKKLKKAIIPVGATGYESKAIWEDVKAHMTEYPYLENAINDLGYERRPEKLIPIIMKILSLISE